MKIKRLKSIKINCFDFEVRWDKTHNGGWFNFHDDGNYLNIGTKGRAESEIFMILCHELMEICTCEMNVRLRRPDVDTDYIFVYDHRQFETMMNMFAGLIGQFIGEK